jgi:dTDP-4-dehydrorhamnose reductase
MILRAHARALIIRPGELIAPHDDRDPLRQVVTALARGERVSVANNTSFTATYVPDLVSVALDLLIDRAAGIWHLTNSGARTPYQLLVAAAERLQLDTSLIDGMPAWSSHAGAARPRNRALRSERAQFLPPWQNALDRWVGELPALVTEALPGLAA